MGILWLQIKGDLGMESGTIDSAYIEHMSWQINTSDDVRMYAAHLMKNEVEARRDISLYDLGSHLLMKPTFDPELVSTHFEDVMKPTQMLGNSLADTGKYLSRYDESQDRGHWALQASARV